MTLLVKIKYFVLLYSIDVVSTPSNYDIYGCDLANGRQYEPSYLMGLNTAIMWNHITQPIQYKLSVICRGVVCNMCLKDHFLFSAQRS